MNKQINVCIKTVTSRKVSPSSLSKSTSKQQSMDWSFRVSEDRFCYCYQKHLFFSSLALPPGVLRLSASPLACQNSFTPTSDFSAVPLLLSLAPKTFQHKFIDILNNIRTLVPWEEATMLVTPISIPSAQNGTWRRVGSQ